MSLLLALLAQIGPFVNPGGQSGTSLPPEMQQREAIERRQDQRQAPKSAETPVPNPASQLPFGQPADADPESRLGACLAIIAEDPPAAAEAARQWLERATGAERAEAGQCLGGALSALRRFGEARAALLAARDAAAPGDHIRRARLGAMAGNASLAEGDAAGALNILNSARDDAVSAQDGPLVSGIATDRARALVTLKREAEAASALADARTADPKNPQAWLLSATLSRRMDRLVEAQAQIERAAQLMPVDPEIGLEAGVIAMLAGREDAARKSWQSVVAAAPHSEAAATASAYLAQIGAIPVPAAQPQEGR